MTNLNPKYIILDEGTGPVSVNAGQSSIYPKADGLFYQKDENEVESLLSVTGSIIDELIPFTNFGNSGSLEITNIPQTYDHLRLVVGTKDIYIGDGLGTVLTINNDTTTSNYDTHISGHSNNNGSAAETNNLHQTDTGFRNSQLASVSAPSESYSISDHLFYDYKNTSYVKAVFITIFGIRTRTRFYNLSGSGRWNSTSAISSMTLNTQLKTGYFHPMSFYQLFGIIN